MKIDLKALRELCDAAGDEWKLTEVMGHSHIRDAEGKTVIGYSTKGPNCIWSRRARFIAATDPQTVRALIDEIERLRGALKRWVDVNDMDFSGCSEQTKQALGENHDR